MDDRPVQRGRRQAALGWGLVALLLIALSPLGARLASAAPACPFKTLTGVPCPACGTTRAALTLAELRPFEALALYPLQTLGWTFLIVGGLMAGAWALADRPLPGLPRRLPPWATAALVTAVLLNWLYSWHTGV